MNDYTLNILRHIYLQKRFIALVIVLAFLASVVRVIFAGQEYRAETTLVITSVPPTGEKGLIMPEQISPKVYQTMATSMDVLGQVLGLLDDANAFTGTVPELRDFSGMLVTQLETVDPTARPMTYSPILALRATADTYELAVAIVDTWAKVLIDTAQQVNNIRIAGVSNAMIDRTNDHKQLLDTVWVELAEETAQYDLKLLREELERRQILIHNLDEKLVDARIELRAAEERLIAVEQQLEVEPEIKELFRSPSETAYWIVESTTDRDEILSELEQKGMRTEEINPAFTELRKNLAAAQQDVASYRARMESLVQQLESIRALQRETQTLLAERELVQTRLTSEETHMRQSYVELANLRTYLESTGLIISGHSPDAIYPVGLNRMSEQIYASSDPGILGRKGRVLLATMIAALLAIGVAVFPVVGQPFLDQIRQDVNKTS